MLIIAKSALKNGEADHNQPRRGVPEEIDEDEEGLELPVQPDEGTPLIPDEEREVSVPS
jgi:hypothetical protein